MEKAAYLEAHFRRKALVHQTSLDSQTENEGSVKENGSYETSTHEENRDGIWCHTEIHDQHNEEIIDASCYDKSSADSCYEGDTKGIEGNMSFNGYSVPKSVQTYTVRHSDEKYFHGANFLEDIADSVENGVTSCNSDQIFKNDSGSDSVITYDVEHINKVMLKSNDQPEEASEKECSTCCNEAKASGLELRAADRTVSSGIRSRSQGTVRSVASNIAAKKAGSQNTDRRKEQTPSRMRIQKEMSTLIGSSLQSSVRIMKTENPRSFKAKSPVENKSEMDLKSRRAITLQPSTPERTESRGHLSTVRTRNFASTNKEIKKCAKNSGSRLSDGDERSEQEMKDNELRQVARNLNAKSKLVTTSMLQDIVSRGSRAHKARVTPTSNRSSRLIHSKSLCLGDQRVLAPKPLLERGDKQTNSPSKTDGTNVSSVRRNSDINKTSRARLHASKEFMKKEKETEGKKHPLAEDRQALDRRTMKAVSEEMRSNGNAILRKSNIGRSSAMNCLTVGVAS